MSDSAPRYRITLVHGTFARGAPWTQDDSRLSTSLRSRLDGTVEIERCEWSGWNTAGARADGARNLVRHLRAQGEKAVDERRFVVAHSHAGNIALYALCDTEAARLCDGVVCMSTPFFVARRRDLGPKGTENILLVLLVASFVFYRWMIRPSLVAATGELGDFAGMFVFSVVAALALWLLYVRWNRMAERVLETLRLAELPSHRLLVLRATGDEASAVLIFFQFLSLLAIRLFHLMQRIYAAIERSFVAWSSKKLALLAAGAAGSLVMFGLLWLVLEAGWTISTAVGIVMIAALTFLVVVPGFLLLGWIGPATSLLRLIAALALVPAAAALALCTLPIDWRVALANLLVDVTTEAAPAGMWTMHQFVPERAEAAGQAAPGLAHSAIYDDERAIRVIVDWMRGFDREPR
jgi:hypothetical protein